MNPTANGQVTIPRHILKFLGISDAKEVDFSIRENEVVLIKKATTTNAKVGKKWEKLRGSLEGKITTAEWMQATRGD